MEPFDEYALGTGQLLGDRDLLALVLGPGCPSVLPLDTASALLHQFGSLSGVMNAPVVALLGVRGIGPARAVRLHAALQAGLRASRRPQKRRAVIDSPDAAWRALEPALGHLDVEELHLLLLDRRRRLLSRLPVTRGSDMATIVDPRQVFRPAVQIGAAAIIVAHNHPSGDPSPSAQDLAVTRRLVEVGALLGVPLLDHIIVASNGWTSLAEQGLVPDTSDGRSGWLRCTG